MSENQPTSNAQAAAPEQIPTFTLSADDNSEHFCALVTLGRTTALRGEARQALNATIREFDLYRTERKLGGCR